MVIWRWRPVHTQIRPLITRGTPEEKTVEKMKEKSPRKKNCVEDEREERPPLRVSPYSWAPPAASARPRQAIHSGSFTPRETQ